MKMNILGLTICLSTTMIFASVTQAAVPTLHIEYNQKKAQQRPTTVSQVQSNTSQTQTQPSTAQTQPDTSQNQSTTSQNQSTTSQNQSTTSQNQTRVKQQSAINQKTTQKVDQNSVIPVSNVLQFGEKVATMAFTYDYQNYQQRFKKLSTYFTHGGWDSFTQAIKESKNLIAVVNAKLSVTSKLVNKATLIKRGKYQQRDAWWVTVPLIVTYSNPKNVKLVQHLDVNLRIIKVAKRLYPEQIAVNQFVAKPAASNHKSND